MVLKTTRAKTKKGRQRVISANIDELHGGPRYKANVGKFGKAKADKIAVAAGINAAKPKRKKRKK